MSDKPLPSIEDETMEEENRLYVSPVTGKTIKQVYDEVREREANMTDEEKIKRLREGIDLFNDMFPNFYDED